MKVVIVGAGVAGLAIGWRLLQQGASVAILERAQPAQGATWASAGMIAAAAELSEAGPSEIEFARHSSALWPGFAAEVEAASGTVIGYRPSGSLIVANTPAEAADLVRRASMQKDVTFVDAARARALEPMLTADLAGALWVPDEAQVDNRKLGRALASAFLHAGGELLVNEAAIRMETADDRVVGIRTPFARHEADAFVLAAGAWTAQIEGLPREAVPPVRPVKGEMIALEPPAGRALPARVVWGNGVYLVPRDDRLLVGATVEEAGFDTSLTSAARDLLQRRATALMPVLADWEICEHWAGLRPATPDHLPVLGPTLLRSLFVASGQYRNGILFAPAIAELMQHLVLEQAGLIAAFDPRRFSGASAGTP